MRKLRGILRLQLDSKLSLRQIHKSLRLSLGAVQKIASQAESMGLNWSSIESLNYQELARLFYPQSDTQVSRLS